MNQIKEILKLMIKKLSTKEITDIISEVSKVSKKQIYEYCLKLKKKNKI